MAGHEGAGPDIQEYPPAVAVVVPCLRAPGPTGVLQIYGSHQLKVAEFIVF